MRFPPGLQYAESSSLKVSPFGLMWVTSLLLIPDQKSAPRLTADVCQLGDPQEAQGVPVVLGVVPGQLVVVAGQVVKAAVDGRDAVLIVQLLLGLLSQNLQSRGHPEVDLNFGEWQRKH